MSCTCRVQGITVRSEDGGLTIARILPGSIIEKQGCTT